MNNLGRRNSQVGTFNMMVLKRKSTGSPHVRGRDTQLQTIRDLKASV